MTKAKTRTRRPAGWEKHVTDRGVTAGDPWITVPREAIREVLRGLQADGYRGYAFVTAVDHLATPVEPPPP